VTHKSLVPHDSALRVMHSHGRLNLSVSVKGNGPRHIVLLHGYGLSADSFSSLLTNELDYTYHCVDLLFHGHSQKVLEGDHPLDSAELVPFFTSYLASHQVHVFSMIAYSMGARVALVLLEEMASRVDQAHLVAPDGFYQSRWYQLAVGSAAGRAVFSALPTYLDAIHRLAGGLRAVGLLSESRFTLLAHNANNKKAAKRLVNTWMALREIKPDIRRVLDFSSREESTLYIHLGRYDKVIQRERIVKSREGKRLLPLIYDYETGHRMLRTDIFKKIFSLLELS